MKKVFSILLLCVILGQLTYALPVNFYGEKSKSEATAFTFLDENKEVLPDNFRVQRPTSEISTEYKFSSIDGLSQFKKGNSLFYIHNQLLPKKLTLSKIRASFFTSHFSTTL